MPATLDRVPWHADCCLSVDRDKFRAAIDAEVERLRGRLKSDVALGIWLKAKCGADVNTAPLVHARCMTCRHDVRRRGWRVSTWTPVPARRVPIG